MTSSKAILRLAAPILWAHGAGAASLGRAALWQDPPASGDAARPGGAARQDAPHVAYGRLPMGAERLGAPRVLFLHIPKAAGTSFKQDASSVITDMVSVEGCYSWRLDYDREQVVMMLRRPRELALSLYYHCKTSPYPPDWAKALMPDAFETWVHNWTQILADGGMHGDWCKQNSKYEWKMTYETRLPFKCYSPVDLQVQRLTCNRPYRYPQQANVGSAIEAMQSAYFVGLAEAYRESVCLLHAKVEGTLPPGCDCEAAPERDYLRMTHETHNVTEHSLEGERAEVLQELARITSGDDELYRKAVERFVREAREVERRMGTKILCPDVLQRLAA